VSIIPS